MSAFFRTAARPVFAKDVLQRPDRTPRIIQLALLALFLLPLPTPLSIAESFKNPQWIRTNSTPTRVLEADLNGDGKPDLVYTSGYVPNAAVHILINQGSGAFTKGQDIAFPGIFGVSVEVGDVNSDGNTDLVILLSSAFTAEIGVALGNGDGTFQPLIISQLPSYSEAEDVYPEPANGLVVALRPGGIPDLVLTDAQANKVITCFGDNAGHFAVSAIIDNGSGPMQIYPGDFNGDGNTDLIVHGFLGADATAYINNGDGTLMSGVRYTGVNQITSIFVRDVDGDGHADMVVTDYSNRLDILHGNPDGTFIPTKSVPTNVGAYAMLPTLVDIEDYNADGILDLALQSLDGIHILIGTGDFNFQPLPPAPVSTFPGTPTITDLNQDGRVDFAFPITGGIAILYGQPGGSLHSADAYDVGYVVSSAALSDFNGDHNADIAVGVDSLNPRILLGNSDGTFTLQPDMNTSSSGVNANVIVYTGDFNGDGRPDLLVNGSAIFFPGIPGISYQFGNGDGKFGPLTGIPGYSGTDWSGVGGLTAGDLNRDGLSDIVAGLDVLLSIGGGSFRKAFTFPVPNGFPTGSLYVFADFNHDGNIDAAFVGNQALQVENGNGDGTFQMGFSYSQSSPTDPSTDDVVAVDIDGDGNMDIAASMPNQIEIFYGHGDGTFDEPQFIPVTVTTPTLITTVCCVYGIGVADFNKDGFQDLAVATSQGVSILHGIGNRAFGPQTDYLAGQNPVKPLIGDFNHDGYPDIAVANDDVNKASTITVLLNIPSAPATPVTLTLSSAPNPSVVNEPVIFTANIGSANGIPTGSLMLSYGNTQLATLTPDANGIATFTSSTLPTGFDEVTATYPGSATYGSANASVTQQVLAGLPVQVAITSSLNPANPGQSITFVALVTSTSGAPTGNVTFTDGSTPLATVPLSAATSSAIYTTSSLSAGSHTITANFQGTGGYANSSANLNQIINSIPTTIAVSVTPTTLYAVEPATITAKVTGTGGVSAGTIAFTANGSNIGTGAVNSAGVATITYSFPTPGTQSLVAAFGGSGNFGSSTSQPTQINVLINTSATSLTATPNPALAFQSTTLVARVTSPGGVPLDGVPSGTVSFSDGASNLGTATLNSSSVATIAVNTFQAGPHALTAVYSGDLAFAASTSPGYALTVNPLPTATTVAANPNPAALGAPVTFSATVSALTTPTGTVAFFDGDAALGTSPLDTKGNATLITSSLALGSHTITASYSASQNFAASASPVLTETIVPFIGDFSITAGPSARTLYTGEAASYDVALISSGGWNQAVTLTCAGLPANTTCTFTPATIPEASGASELTVQTTAPAHVGSKQSSNMRWPERTGIAVVAAALLVFPYRRRRFDARWMLALLIAFGVLSGCGAGPIAGGTPPGAYTITVNATSSEYGQTLVHSTNVKLTVKSLF